MMAWSRCKNTSTKVNMCEKLLMKKNPLEFTTLQFLNSSPSFIETVVNKYKIWTTKYLDWFWTVSTDNGIAILTILSMPRNKYYCDIFVFEW